MSNREITLDAAIADKLLQQAPDALLLADADGNIRFTNAAITALFGYRPEELFGQPIELLLPERYRGAHIHHRAGYVAQPAQRTMGRRGVSLFGRRQDGSEFPIWVSLSPITVDGVMQIAAAIRDVTDWEELTQHLREASDEARQASQTKSRFLATASHDLRQPLQALQLLNASLERKLTTDTDTLNIITRQQHAIDSMTELLNALLDISKLESGTVKVNHETVNAFQILNEVREQFESVVAAKGLSLDTQIANISLTTDRVLLLQLVQNLVGNAIKYTDHGRISLKLLYSQQESVIEVSDTGVGISRDQLAKIFDAYYQLHGSRPDRPGVGLGLAIVKQITELLGFGISVESQPGRGTTFRVTIPCEMVSTQQSVLQQTSPPASGVLPQGQCILIIEDDHAVREAIALALELEGFVTLSAGTENAAQTLYTEHAEKIAAIVSDYHVDASCTGVDIVTNLRSHAGARRLPAVFLTGDTSLALRSQKNLPDSRLLNKPVDINRLVQNLTELLQA